jgi:predicted LPLAT superfamily acyltransferase
MSNNAWRSQQEVGHMRWINILLWLVEILPRWVFSLVLYGVSAFYVLKNRAARRASVHYWMLLQGTVNWLTLWRHFYTFARVSMDRLIMLKQGFTHFRVEITEESRACFNVLRTERESALLLVNHLGSFDVLRKLAEELALPPIKILLDKKQNPQFMQLMSEYNPPLANNIIDVADGGYPLAIQLASAAKEGCWIGIMADRLQGNEAAETLEFVGAPAKVPLTPWQIASILNTPVYACAGIYCGGNLYRVFLKKISAGLAAPRKERPQVLHQAVQDYFSYTENLLRRYPYNWFNFYEFWHYEPR